MVISKDDGVKMAKKAFKELIEEERQTKDKKEEEIKKA